MATGKIVDFNTKEENLHYHGVLDIDPIELNQKKEEVVLVDVRMKEEYDGELGHIKNSRLIPLDVVDEYLTQKADIDKTIVFVCRSGARSARATTHAQELGYKSVYNLKGGMLLWNELELEVENTDLEKKEL